MNDVYHEHNSSRDLTSNRDVLRRATEKFLNSVIDDLTLGIIFETHRKYKTSKNNRDADCEGSASINDFDYTTGDIFGQDVLKKIHKLNCPKCHRVMAPTRLAYHLDTCMGLALSSGKRVSRRIANHNDAGNNANANASKDRENSTYSGLHSGDDDDDDDWSSSYKKPRKKLKSRKKKSGSSNKKKSLGRYNIDSSNGEEEDMDISVNSYTHEETNSHTPIIDLVTNVSNGSLSKRKDRKKKSKRDHSHSPIPME